MTFAFAFANICARKLAVRYIGIVQYSFLSCIHKQPTRIYRQGQFHYPIHLSRPNHVDQPQEFLGLLLMRFSKQMLNSLRV